MGNLIPLDGAKKQECEGKSCDGPGWRLIIDSILVVHPGNFNIGLNKVKTIVVLQNFSSTNTIAMFLLSKQIYHWYSHYWWATDFM